MAMRLAGRQLAIMKVLWEKGEASVADVQELLPITPPLAYSTTATVMARMEQKGLIRHRAEGRTFYYQPAVSEGSVVGDLVDRMFSGRPSELVSHLLEANQIDSEELDRIKQLVRQHEAALRQSGKKGGRS